MATTKRKLPRRSGGGVVCWTKLPPDLIPALDEFARLNKWSRTVALGELVERGMVASGISVTKAG